MKRSLAIAAAFIFSTVVGIVDSEGRENIPPPPSDSQTLWWKLEDGKCAFAAKPDDFLRNFTTKNRVGATIENVKPGEVRIIPLSNSGRGAFEPIPLIQGRERCGQVAKQQQNGG